MLHVTVYRGNSVNRQNGGSWALAEFGRFQAVLDMGTVTVQQSDSGEFYYTFPLFCSCGQCDTEAEATEAAHAWIASNRDGWTTDKAAAEANAVKIARERHEYKCAGSENYRRAYAN